MANELQSLELVCSSQIFLIAVEGMSYHKSDPDIHQVSVLCSSQHGATLCEFLVHFSHTCSTQCAHMAVLILLMNYLNCSLTTFWIQSIDSFLQRETKVKGIQGHLDNFQTQTRRRLNANQSQSEISNTTNSMMHHQLASI